MSNTRNQRGAVTAEAAVVMPSIVLLAAALAWMVSFGVAEVRAIDAARETARALARGEEQNVSVGLGTRVAPAGARIAVRTDGDLLVVTVSATLDGPAGLFGLVRGPEITAEAVAAREDG